MTSAGPVTGSVHARARTARHPAPGVVAALALLPGGCGPGAPAALPADLSDLPITVVAADATPAATPAAPPAGDAPLPFVILFSGDGGWAPLVDGISHRLAAAGVPVVGVSSQKYFWDEREPDVIARDIARIAARYSALWGRTRFALAGFSFGADAVPFAVPLLDAADRADLDALVLISPLRDADFEFHVSSWWNRGDTGVPIAPEMAKLGTLPVEIGRAHV